MQCSAACLTRCLLLLVACLLHGAKATNKVAKSGESHFAPYGVRYPELDFLATLDAAAINVSSLSGRNKHSLVFMVMVNEVALNRTVPIFLQSLAAISYNASSGQQKTLAQGVVVACWSQEALDMCSALQSQFQHQCVIDLHHQGQTHGSYGFHSDAWNALGFARIKYILNTLSTGHDVVFLDTDIVLLRNPLPYILGLNADIVAAVEQCRYLSDKHQYQLAKAAADIPAFNIGVMYCKNTPAVTRCVYNWFFEMFSEAQTRPRVWDQDIFGKIMVRCTKTLRVNWHAFDPRLFYSACYPGCGCTYNDSDVDKRHLDLAKGRPYLDKVAESCGPVHWQGWYLAHFPCSGKTEHKGELMQNLLTGVQGNTTAVLHCRRFSRALMQ